MVPEVAIGALGKFQVLPRFDAKQQVVPQTIMVIRYPFVGLVVSFILEIAR